MAWENVDEFPEWPLDVMANNLATFLRETCGWDITIDDWTTEEGYAWGAAANAAADGGADAADTPE